MERTWVGNSADPFCVLGIMFYIYILHSQKADKFYVGHTDDPMRRLSEHNTKPFNTFTSRYRPWTMAAYFPAGEIRGEAIRMERYIKKLKSKKLILELIQEQKNPERIAQLVRVPTCQN